LRDEIWVGLSFFTTEDTKKNLDYDYEHDKNGGEVYPGSIPGILPIEQATLLKSSQR
jgi:hypothetical protein